jgi:hypothetical protein
MNGIGFGSIWQVLTCDQLSVAHGIKKREGSGEVGGDVLQMALLRP